ncbi:uncharacterized protein [Parasteatoda tepidariorum]|uniref:uncharacterized protein n=1 Tax=Parasteatoda tepidariorum TaxID=114398 RepID=UPI001C71B827|nr:uncharacterized protein LOC107446902 [Parasteatoda tepidariorum]
MCSLFLLLTFLFSIFYLTEGRMISCACTTRQCLEEGTKTCNTTSLCFSQFLDRKDGSDPLVRGCVAGSTPLLCENRRPAIGLHRQWPVLMCCNKHMCNAKVYPTMPTTTTPFILPVTSHKPILFEPPSSAETGVLESNAWYVVMLVAAVLLFGALVAIGIFFITRQSTFFDPEFGVVGPNGYVKGCNGQRPIPSKGLENKLVSDT